MSRGYTDQQRANDYKTVFGSPLGQKVLTDIMLKGSVFRPHDASEASDLFRAEGARWLALHIASFVKFDAATFMDAWQNPEDVA